MDAADWWTRQHAVLKPSGPPKTVLQRMKTSASGFAALRRDPQGRLPQAGEAAAGGTPEPLAPG